jgi:CRP-like cAMP-binding protein
MTDVKPAGFDLESFLSRAGRGRTILEVEPKRCFYTQGSPADSIFYLQAGRAKLSVVSECGKEATVMILVPGDFIGEESLATVGGIRLASATAITACRALKVDKREMIQAMHQEDTLSQLFLTFLLGRSIRVQASLVDQLFNCTEKRLARALVLMAELGKAGDSELIPQITQEALAEMIGTTRSRVNFFMNRFRKLGFIEYKGRIRVNRSLLNVVLHD